VGAQRSVSATMRVTGPHRGIAAPAGERPAVRRAPRDDTLQVSGFPGIRESKVGVWCKSIVSADPAAPSTGNRRLRTALFHPIFFLQGRFLQNDKPLALDDHARCSPGFQHRGLRAERRAHATENMRVVLLEGINARGGSEGLGHRFAAAWGRVRAAFGW